MTGALLAVVTLRQDAASDGADGTSFVVAGESLVAVHDWTFLHGPGFVVGIGNGLTLGYLMYPSGLVPRRPAVPMLDETIVHMAVARDPVPQPSTEEIVSAFQLEGTPPRVLVPVAGAWSNRVYRLQTGATAYAVKQMLNPWGEPGWRSWLGEAWQLELAAFDNGIPMPRPIPARDGGCLADVPTHDGLQTVPVRVHEWVEGQPCPTQPVDEQVARRLGQALAGIHDLRHRPRREDVFPRITRAGMDGWPSLVDRLAEVDPAVGRHAAEMSRWIVSMGDLFEAADTDFRGQPMSHGDVDQKNVLLTRRGPVLSDWDVAAPWDRRAELARTAMSLACWERPEVARWTISAYQRAWDGDGMVPEPRDLAVDLVISLDWVIFCLESATGLRPADDRRQQQSRELVPTLLSALPRQVDTALHIGTWLGGR